MNVRTDAKLLLVELRLPLLHARALKDVHLQLSCSKDLHAVHELKQIPIRVIWKIFRNENNK